MAMESIALANDGNIEDAIILIKSAREEINKAHKHQTSLIQAEAVLLIHSQDHLMNGMTVIDMAEQFINFYEIVKK